MTQTQNQQGDAWPHGPAIENPTTSLSSSRIWSRCSPMIQAPVAAIRSWENEKLWWPAGSEWFLFDDTGGLCNLDHWWHATFTPCSYMSHGCHVAGSLSHIQELRLVAIIHVPNITAFGKRWGSQFMHLRISINFCPSRAARCNFFWVTSPSWSPFFGANHWCPGRAHPSQSPATAIPIWVACMFIMPADNASIL